MCRLQPILCSYTTTDSLLPVDWHVQATAHVPALPISIRHTTTDSLLSCLCPSRCQPHPCLASSRPPKLVQPSAHPMHLTHSLLPVDWHVQATAHATTLPASVRHASPPRVPSNPIAHLPAPLNTIPVVVPVDWHVQATAHVAAFLPASATPQQTPCCPACALHGVSHWHASPPQDEPK